MTVEGLKFAHLGDVHLGYSFSYLPREKRLTRQRELKETFTRVVEEVVKEEVALVLLAGDLLEHGVADKTLMRFIDDNLSRISCPVLMITGNHDPLLPDSPYLSHSWPDNVHLFREDGWQAVRLEHLDTTVLGLSYHLPEERSHRLKSIPTFEDSTYKIILVHGSFLESSSLTSPYLPIAREDIERLNIDYLALGHYHNFQTIHDAGGRLIGCYPGSPEPLDFSETGTHGFVIGEMMPGETRVKFVPVVSRVYHQEDLDITGSETMQDIRNRIVAALHAGSPEDLWSLNLTGEIDPDLNLNCEWLQEELKAKSFFVKLRSSVAPAYNLAELKKRAGVVSYFIGYMESLLEKAEEIEEKDKITAALATGLDALLKGEVKIR